MARKRELNIYVLFYTLIHVGIKLLNRTQHNTYTIRICIRMYSYSATEMQEKIDFHGELFEEIREYPEAEKLEQVDKPQIRGWNFKLDLFSIRPQILKLCPNTAAHYLCRPNPPFPLLQLRKKAFCKH